MLDQWWGGVEKLWKCWQEERWTSVAYKKYSTKEKVQNVWLWRSCAREGDGGDDDRDNEVTILVVNGGVLEEVEQHNGENQGKHLGEFKNRTMKTWDAVEGFHQLENSHKLYWGFHQAIKARITCFIYFIKLLFSVLTKRKMIYKACIYTLISFIHETVNSYKLKANHITHVIFVLR